MSVEPSLKRAAGGEWWRGWRAKGVEERGKGIPIGQGPVWSRRRRGEKRVRNNNGDRDVVGASGGEGSVPLPTVGSQQRRSKRKINNRGPGGAT